MLSVNCVLRRSIVMRLTHMTERIEFLGSKEVQNKYGVMVPQKDVPLFSCWAEVLNTPIREFKDATTKVGNRKESPNFAIKFEPQRLIDSSWQVYKPASIRAFTITSICSLLKLTPNPYSNISPYFSAASG